MLPKPLLFFLSSKFTNPKITFDKKVQHLKLALKFEFRGLLWWLFIIVVDGVISLLLKTKPILASILSGHHGFKGMEPQKLLLLAVIVAPILEELAFRGFMNFKKYMISLSVSTLSYFSMQLFLRSVLELWVIILLTIAAFSICFLLLKNEKIYSYILVRRNFSFYSMSVLFAIVHLTNYDVALFSNFNFLLIPFAVFPQGLSAISLAYLRLKNGLIWSIFFHSFINFVIVTIYILSQNLTSH